jgi:two-component system osmolarity sensor histidine kinase EnvZ
MVAGKDLPPRILNNILANALRYGHGKPVSITYDCQKEAAIIQIMDRGPGIPAEHIDAVFRPFFRLEKSRGSETGGQLADANGWDVQLMPRAGGGTNAILTIPCHQ